LLKTFIFAFLLIVIIVNNFSTRVIRCLVFDCSAVTGCQEIFVFIRRSLAGNLDTLIVEANTNVGGKYQRWGNTVGVGGGKDSMAVGGGGDAMAVGSGKDSMAVGGGGDAMAVGGGEDAMAVGGGEDSRVDNSGISFSLLHNMLEFTILGDVTGEA